MVMSLAGVFNPDDPKGVEVDGTRGCWACATEKVSIESRTRQKRKTKFLVSTRLLLIQFRICIVSSVLSKVWIWAALERSPGKQVLAVVH